MANGGTPTPSQARLLITPRSQNLRLGAPPSPAPRFPAEGTDGEYVADSGPLLAAAVVPARLALLRDHFGSRLHTPSRVAEELERLVETGNPLERAAATEAMRSLTSGFPAVETLTSEEAALAEGRLFDHLTALQRQPRSAIAGQHLGECHALALALRFGASSTILLTNDGPASVLARANGVRARSINGLLREVCLCPDHGYTAEQAWEDVQLMAAVSAPPASDRATGPDAFT